MKAVIFDLDGTIVDNMMVHHRAWQRKLSSLGLQLTLEEVKQQVHGINEEIIHKLFGGRFTAPERARISWEKEKEYRDIFAQDLKPLPGFTSFIEGLKQTGIPLAVGTAAPVENVDFVLDNLSIRHYFDSVLHSGDVTNGKPDPEIFVKSAENMGVAVSDCLVFEDSVIGAQTALNAGCPVVIVTTTHDQEEFLHFPHVIRFISDYHHLQPHEFIEVN